MNAVERNTDALVNDLKRVVRHSEELLASTSEAVGEKASQARKRLAEAVQSANDRCVNLQERTLEAARNANSLVREHPYETIALGIVVGFVAGVLLNRK